MDGAGNKRIAAVATAQKTGGLFKGLGSETLYLLERVACWKRTIFVPMLDDVFRKRRPQTGDVRKKLDTCRIDFHTDRIDTTDHHIIKTPLQF